MANERDDDQFDETEGSSNKEAGAQQGQQHLGQNQQNQAEAGGLGSQPTMSDQDSSSNPQGGQTFSQSDIARQSSSGQTQSSGGSDTLTSDQGPGAGTTSSGGGSDSSGGQGFVGSSSASPSSPIVIISMNRAGHRCRRSLSSSNRYFSCGTALGLVLRTPATGCQEKRTGRRTPLGAVTQKVWTA